jgi:hypothetical protein
MRRLKQSSDSPSHANEGPTLPSTKLVDVFGRFVGIVVSTVFERCFRNCGENSDFQSEFRRSMTEIVNFGAGDLPRDEPKCSGRSEDVPPQLHDRKSEDTERATEEEIDSELRELKRRLSEKSSCQGGDCDRSIALISRSTAFFGREGDWSYHLCPFQEKAKFEGLIAFLTARSGGNPHDKGVIAVTSTNGSGNEGKNAVDLRSDLPFCSANQPNQWLCYDFKDLRVGVTHYTVRSNGCNKGSDHLQSWVVEGSEDNSKWTELDRRENDDRLNGPNSICSFDVRTVVESRFIQIRSIGSNWAGNQYVYFKAFEVFGGLRVPKSHKVI